VKEEVPEELKELRLRNGKGDETIRYAQRNKRSEIHPEIVNHSAPNIGTQQIGG